MYTDRCWDHLIIIPNTEMQTGRIENIPSLSEPETQYAKVSDQNERLWIRKR